jgi:hypothetical protein
MEIPSQQCKQNDIYEPKVNARSDVSPPMGREDANPVIVHE